MSRLAGSNLWRQVHGQEEDSDAGTVIPPREAHVSPGSEPWSLALSTVSRLQMHQLLWGPLVATLARIICLVEPCPAFVVQRQLSLTSRLH